MARSRTRSLLGSRPSRRRLNPWLPWKVSAVRASPRLDWCESGVFENVAAMAGSFALLLPLPCATCSWASSSPVDRSTVHQRFSLDGRELWNYPLPPGVRTRPVEPIIPGKLTREGPGQWILPGSDGSVHIISADGKPLDKFNTGVALQGLATVEIDGHPALITASEQGLVAWKVE